MKKILIIVLVAVVAGSSIFAMDLSFGVMQNYINTCIVADLEFNHFGFEESIGFPLIRESASLIGAISEGKDIDFGDDLAMGLLPGIMVNGYWKAINTKHFGLRLGLQADVMGISNGVFSTVLGIWGASIGLNFKFGERFSANITGTIPATYPLSFISDDAEQFGYFILDYYGLDKVDNVFDAFVYVLEASYGFISEIARVSFKWKI